MISDIVAIGLGPFNLGLAALAEPLDLDVQVLESRSRFAWHPGLMLEGATIQVPFLADLVTMADPTSPFSFLNYLRHVDRLYPFYVRESFYPLRAEYDDYCRWVAGRLQGVYYSRHVVAVTEDAERDCLVVTAETPTGPMEHATRHVVVGIGTEAHIPAAIGPVASDPRVVHSSTYLDHRSELLHGDRLTLVGSGQSAAEIFLDLLGRLGPDQHLTWLTRSPRFFPMEYTKLTLELTSPEYTAYFHGLPDASRDRLNREQRSLYKGISAETVNAVHEALYRLGRTGRPPVTLITDTEVTASNAGAHLHLGLRHQTTGVRSGHRCDRLILATGYRPRRTDFLNPLGDRIARDDRGRLDVALDFTIDHGAGRIFVQNAEEHTHGLSAPDLGMGAWRSSVILNQVCGKEAYPMPGRAAFQHFGPLEVATDVR